MTMEEVSTMAFFILGQTWSTADFRLDFWKPDFFRRRTNVLR